MKTQRKLMLVFAIVTVFAAAGLSHAGDLDQTAAPAPTMKTLDEIYNGVDNIPPAWSQKLPASERFVLVLDGEAVLDRETGLVWEKSPGTSTTSFYDACYQCYQKEVGGRTGWRLPTIEELMSIVDRSNISPALPSGHPFSNVQQDFYWSTSNGNSAGQLYTVNFANGVVVGWPNSNNYYWWCVRGAPGHNTFVQ
ncbi:MAG: DUF1566 domain-containing protein [Deltaproteobacteria bacterium]|nr:DUF1566 domain-containing protein [Deltaproteobacteria bacterium]